MTTPSDPAPSAATAPPRKRRPRRVHGPVYQSVTRQIRAQFGTTKTRTPEQAAAFARVAGYVGSCRSLAASIDRATGDDPCPNVGLPGHDCRRHQVTGREIAGLHEQLARMLARLEPPQEDAAGGQAAALRVLVQHLTPGVPPTTPPLPGVEP